MPIDIFLSWQNWWSHVRKQLNIQYHQTTVCLMKNTFHPRRTDRASCPQPVAISCVPWSSSQPHHWSRVSAVSIQHCLLLSCISWSDVSTFGTNLGEAINGPREPGCSLVPSVICVLSSYQWRAGRSAAAQSGSGLQLYISWRNQET